MAVRKQKDYSILPTSTTKKSKLFPEKSLFPSNWIDLNHVYSLDLPARGLHELTIIAQYMYIVNTVYTINIIIV